MALAACAPDSPLSKLNSPDKPQVGRYAVAAGPNGAILLDTATGETWHQVSVGKDWDVVTQWLPMEKTTTEDWIKFNRQLERQNSN
jgi:hypothetical protein